MDIKLINVTKKYKTLDEKYLLSLNSVNVDINYGNYLSFVGPSGCGKTTLLSIITGNLKPTMGDIFGENTVLIKLQKKFC